MSGLTDIIDNILTLQAIENLENQNSKGKFYPSSIGKCLRAIVYQMLGYHGKPLDPQTVRIMENGNDVHNRLEALFRKANILVASELPLKDEQLLISGRLDAVIKNFRPHRPNNKIIKLFAYDSKTGDQIKVYEGPSNDILLVEIKSINDKGFNLVKSKNQPKQEHVLQIQLYMHLTGIYSGIILYENKNTQELYDHYLEYDKYIADKAIYKIMTAKEYYEKNQIPPRQFEKDSNQCRWCDYNILCWENSL